MADNALTVAQNATMMPAMDIGQAIVRHNQLVMFTQQIMIPGIDFGAIPGTEKATLF